MAIRIPKPANARVTVGYKDDDWEHSLGFSGLYVRNAGENLGAPLGFLRADALQLRRWQYLLVWRRALRGRPLSAASTTRAWWKPAWAQVLRQRQDEVERPDRRWLQVLRNPRHAAQQGQCHRGVPRASISRSSSRPPLQCSTSSALKSPRPTISCRTSWAWRGVKVSDRLALNVAYAVRYNTDPPSGFSKTDRLSTVNLVYEVK